MKEAGSFFIFFCSDGLNRVHNLNKSGSKLTLEQAGKFRVSVRNKSIFLAFVAQSTDDVAQRQKAAIDADAWR